ncbi:DtxR family Mn-dependent transcriptional regulator [Pedobacter sp. UYP30]|uniref:metal-dependent transcriptional regulator n=1 Tax=Pedobacter sp. UYP30 TaxID=1756400 RepID=UPI00339908E4
MNSLTVENYLKALFNLSNDKGEVNVNELSKHLNIKMPTVNSMMKKLFEQGFVHYESYKPVKLTDIGKKEAALVIRKHRLTEIFLVEKMGFGWEEVHDIAEQVEHVRSAAFFDKMDHLLGHPKFDPHGAPIPDKEGKIMLRTYKKLNECKVGETVIFKSVTDSSKDFLKFLNKKDLKLGTEIIVLAIEEFDHSTMVGYLNHASETFSGVVCQNIMVEKIGK